MSLNKNTVYYGSYFCDLLVYDKNEKIFYEYFNNSVEENPQKPSDFNMTYYKILTFFSAIISLIFREFFASLNRDIFNILFAVSVFCGISIGVITVYLMVKKVQRNHDEIISNSTYSVLKLSTTADHLKVLKKKFIPLTLSMCFIATVLIIFLYGFYSYLGQALLALILTIMSIHLFLPFLLVPIIASEIPLYVRLKKYQNSFFK